MKPSNRGKSNFTEGEKVLCFQGSLIYEAKILKISDADSSTFFVHYTGWKKKYDEWVPELHVLKFTDENLERQKCLSDQQKILGKIRRAPPFFLGDKKRDGAAKERDHWRPEMLKKGKIGKSNGLLSGPTGNTRGLTRREAALSKVDSNPLSRVSVVSCSADDECKKLKLSKDSGVKQNRKRSLQPTKEDEEQWLNIVEVEIPLPATLKTMLYRDWELVNKEHMEIKLSLTYWIHGISMKLPRPVIRTKIGQLLAYTSLDQGCMESYVSSMRELLEYLAANFEKLGGFNCSSAPELYIARNA
ncbi:unnamed protein product [Notodromas monacha]|uniref:MSL3 chromodomain-like domain-containing protein n=1 Tax=Notodromas monacha TaxID=399045 RepID=A0A7R9G7X8_9CRUS|nr:unnamed protein product [Notodromas monacha]CAG0912680.1 unnamed protein product [Notodromas monacha]